MTSSNAIRRNKYWLYLGLVVVFLACLWIGWRDFDPMISQNEVREMIRANIRWVIQTLVQFVVPGAILVYFAKESLAWARSKKTTTDSDL